MNTPLPTAESRHRRILALCGAVLLAILVFLLLPLSQKLNSQRSEIIVLRETVTIQPPTITAPPAPEAQHQPEPEPKPKFKPQVQELSLSQLELSLNPGISDALKISITNEGFTTDLNAVANIQEMFTFSDLAQAPRILNQPRIQYPTQLIRRNVRQGRVLVKIEIDTKGRATIIRVLSYTHPELIPTAKDVIRQARFTPPTVNGRPQQVQGDWPITLRAP